MQNAACHSQHHPPGEIWQQHHAAGMLFFQTGTIKVVTAEGKMEETKYRTIQLEKYLETAKDLRVVPHVSHI